MRSRFNLAVLTVLVMSLAVGAWAVNPSGKVEWREGELMLQGRELNELRARHIVSPHKHVTATETLVITPTCSFIMIDNNPACATNTYTASTTGAVDGMLLYIYNDSATAATGLATIATQKMGVLFYADGAWKLIADE